MSTTSSFMAFSFARDRMAATRLWNAMVGAATVRSDSAARSSLALRPPPHHEGVRPLLQPVDSSGRSAGRASERVLLEIRLFGAKLAQARLHDRHLIEVAVAGFRRKLELRDGQRKVAGQRVVLP